MAQKFGSRVAVNASTYVNTVQLLVGHFVLLSQFLSCSLLLQAHDFILTAHCKPLLTTWHYSLQSAEIISQLFSSKFLYVNSRWHLSLQSGIGSTAYTAMSFGQQTFYGYLAVLSVLTQLHDQNNAVGFGKAGNAGLVSLLKFQGYWR